MTNVKSDRINLCIYVVYSTDLVGCAGAEEDLDYGRIGMGLGWRLGRGAISLSLTAAPRRLLPPRVSSLSGCAEAHYSVDFVRHTQKPSTLACVGGGPGGGWGSMRSDISVAGVESFCIDVYSCVQKFWRLHLG